MQCPSSTRPLPGSLAGAACFVLFGIASGCDVAEPIVEQTVVLRLVPEVIDFGDVPVGAVATRNLIIENTGNAAFVAATPPAVNGARFAVSGCAIVGPGASCTMVATFSPTNTGPDTGRVVVVPGDNLPDVGAALLGNGTPSTVEFVPPLLDFGVVTLGSSHTLRVSVRNVGDARLEFPLLVDGPGFLLGGAASRDVVIAANDAIDVDVTFVPARGGDASAALRAGLCGVGCGPSADLVGTATAPRIDVNPRILDLGPVDRGDAASGQLVLSNQGTGDLVVDGVRLLGNARGFVVDAPALPILLAGGEQAVVDVNYAPAEGRGAEDLAVVISSSDPLSPVVSVPVVATTPGPGLELLPAVGQFGFLVPDQERPLSVVLRSTGAAPVTVASLLVSSSVSGAFRLTSGPALPLLLLPRESVQFFVTATATPAAVSADGATGTLTVGVEGDELPALSLPLQLSAGVEGCVPFSRVPHAELGGIRLGQGSSASTLIENIGTAPCVLDHVDVDDGVAFDPDFRVSSTASLSRLAPGASGRVEFGLTPASPGPHATIAAVVFRDAATNTLELPVFVSASGTGVAGSLSGVPATATLGPAFVGCADPTQNVAFVNDGPTVLEIDRITIEDATAAAFSVQGPSTATLLPGASVGLEVSGRATAGAATARLVAHTTVGITADIRLTLEVQDGDDSLSEEFVAPAATAVDVLFVVDNSGSMADDQGLLATNFQSFFESALTDRTVDFQVGITTTDVVSAPSVAGLLVGAEGVMDRFTPGLEQAFADAVRVGVEGSGLELGLEAMRLCVERVENAGFIRPDAALSVIFVSDEEDNGAFPEFLPDQALARAPGEYIALLEGLKAGSLDNTPVLVSAVIAPGVGLRYAELVAHFGGGTLDITRPDWGTSLGTLGVQTFALGRSFRLQQAPEVGSVVVTVDGRALAFDDFDVIGDTVVLDEAPTAGDPVVVTYIPGCR